MLKYSFWALVPAILSGVLSAQTGAKKADGPREIFKVEGKLTTDDPFDKKFPKSRHKEHVVKLQAGQKVRIDLKSDEFDCCLRIVGKNGKVLEENDDFIPGNTNSCIIFHADEGGAYKIIVTSYGGSGSPLPGKTGSYVLTVHEATQLDELALQASKVSNKKEAKAVIGELKKYFAAKNSLTRYERTFARDVCGILEGVSIETGASAYAELGGQLSMSADRAASSMGRFMQGIGRRLLLPGHAIDLKGMTSDGKFFDWKAYRGKVVLVDFWATWCGPCRAEFPRMRKMYEAYKERGFEIVAVSIDTDRTALEKFLAKEKLPWPCLHEKDADEIQPLAEQYGVEVVPLPILVGRDGKVISMRANGAELSRLLEKHIGPNRKKSKDE